MCISWSLNKGNLLQAKLVHYTEKLASWGHKITKSFKQWINHIKKIIKIVKGRRDEKSIKMYQEESKKFSEVYTQQEVFGYNVEITLV